jgi:hypothetical protein
MKRACAVFILVVGAVLLAPTKQVDAGPISRNNPYRSFNISGVNYGSMQWENKHRNSNSGKSWTNGRRSGRLRWR